MNDAQFGKLLIIVNGLIPAAFIAWDAYHRRLGANPIEFVLHTTGTIAIVFLLLTLAVTPLRKTLDWHLLIKLRRSLGLFAFFYACLHLLCYSWFDKGFDVGKIVQDTFKRQFIFVGMAAFLLMVPLAITSTNGMLKRLGNKRWLKLHRCAYYVAIGGIVHNWMAVKADTNLPTIFFVLLVVLLGYRYFAARGEQPAVSELKIDR